jgi:hypothetical protein
MSKEDYETEMSDLEMLSEAFRYFLNKRNYVFVAVMMKQFDINNSIAELKTILIVTKAFKDNSMIDLDRQRILYIYEQKIGKIYEQKIGKSAI